MAGDSVAGRTEEKGQPGEGRESNCVHVKFRHVRAPPPQQSPGPPAGGAESLGGASHKEFPMCKVGSDINKPITACSQDTRARAQVRVKWDSGFCGELENQRQTMSSSVNPGSRSSKQPSTRRMRRSAERRHGSRCVCFSVSSQPPRPFGSNSACRSQVG